MTAWVVAIVLLLGPSGQAAGEPESRVSKLLSETKNRAVEIRADIGTLVFFAGSTSGWERYAPIIATYRDHIQAIRELEAKLEDARSIASPVEKTAIELITRLVLELASTAGATIENIDRKTDRVDAKDREDYFKISSGLTDELVGAISNLVDYAKTIQEWEKLTAKFKLSSGW